jgi:adenosine deaminase
VELIASPGHADAVGMTDEEHFGGIAAGIDDARRDHGIEARILAAAVRNHGVESAERLASRLAADRHPYVVGFQLAGDEAGFPPGPFARAYEIAADSGLGCSVHAGEHAGAESVRGALALPVTRIAHGVRAVEDPALVAELAERGTVLEVCPTSNVATGVFASYEDHPLGALRAAGVRVCLGSDDPPYFGCSIGSEYAVARERFGMDEGELREVTRTALEGAFADDGLRRSLLAAVDPASDRRRL